MNVFPHNSDLPRAYVYLKQNYVLSFPDLNTYIARMLIVLFPCTNAHDCNH
jgi:hypothetical protein